MRMSKPTRGRSEQCMKLVDLEHVDTVHDSLDWNALDAGNPTLSLCRCQ